VQLDAVSPDDYQAAGIHRTILVLPSGEPGELIPLPGRYARLAGQQGQAGL
jgi:hypothetical protein